MVYGLVIETSLTNSHQNLPNLYQTALTLVLLVSWSLEISKINSVINYLVNRHLNQITGSQHAECHALTEAECDSALVEGLMSICTVEGQR